MDLVQEAEDSGGNRSASCEVLHLDVRRLQRWKAHPEQPDMRAGPNAQPCHALSEKEKKMIIEVSTLETYRDASPWEIVAKMADLGRYIASESSFYRVLRQKNLLSHRGKSRPQRHVQPQHLIAMEPNQIWSWDITYLKSPIKGNYYYLYLIEDIFSRMSPAFEFGVLAKGGGDSNDDDHSSSDVFTLEEVQFEMITDVNKRFMNS